MKRNRTLGKLFLIFFLILSLTILHQIVIAAEYPSKPIKNVVTWGVGGSTDLISRAISSVASAYLNEQSLITIIKPGASGAIGTRYVLEQPADGYWIMIASPATITMPYMTDVGFTYKDFEAIAYIGDEPYILVVHADSPFKTVQDLINHAKKNPGKLTFSSCGPGSSMHFATEILLDVAGMKAKHVPNKCTGPAALAVLGKHVDFTYLLPTVATPHVNSGKLRVLGITGDKKLGGYDAQTLGALGYPVPFTAWKLVTVKKGTPKDRKEFLVNAFKQILHDKSYLALMKNLNQPTNYMGPEESWKLMQETDAIVAKLLPKMELGKGKK